MILQILILTKKLKSQFMSQDNTWGASVLWLLSPVSLCVILKYQIQKNKWIFPENYKIQMNISVPKFTEIIIFFRYENFHYEP